jgi:VWFA-related protein
MAENGGLLHGGTRGVCKGVSQGLLLLLLVPPLYGQTQPPPTFRLGTELVVVDLVPTDRAGRFVADLQASEVRLLEDGKPQRIEFLRLVRLRPDDPPASSPSVVPPSQPGTPPADDARAPDARREEPARVAIVIDLVSTPAEELPRVKDAIRRMLLEELPDGTEIMLATVWHGLTIQQPFTTNRQTMVAALETVAMPTGGNLSLLEILDTAQRACDTMGLPPLPQLIAMGKSYVLEIQQQLTAASEALGIFTRSLAVLPGRKHVVLYSRGYALNPVGHVLDLIGAAAAACGGDASQFRNLAARELAAVDGFDAAGAVRTLVDQANRWQVSFYAVDPRGLAVTTPQAKDQVSARSTRQGTASRLAALDATLPQEYLRTVAGDTGGRAYLNTNDLARGLRRAWVDASEYYLVGYTPPPADKKGRFRRIDVKVSRPDVDVRFRRGYYERTERDLVAADVQNALRLPDAFEQAGLEVDAFVERAQLRVVSYVPPRALRFTVDRIEACTSLDAGRKPRRLIPALRRLVSSRARM